MTLRTVISKLMLLPCSKIYGAVTYMRNKFFDWGILKQHEFDVPIIVVGNLTVGGTGKTPMWSISSKPCATATMWQS